MSEAIRLEHLRFGPESPVLLFDLAPCGGGEWRNVSPHQCREDCYTATLAVNGERLMVRWSIQGPCKRESIGYIYS
jgi:hypothetical protein